MGFSHTSCLRVMRFCLFIIMTAGCLLSSAQDTLSRDSTHVATDTLQKPEKPVKEFHGGIYLEAGVESVPGMGKRNFSQQFGVGVMYEFVSIGIYQNLALGKTSRTLVFPNDFDLIYGYGGAYVGFRIVKTRMLSGTIRMNYGRGDMVWERADTKEDFTRDTYHLVKPEIQISVIPVKFVKGFVMVGYRQFYDLKLANIANKDFSGVTFAVGIQVGYFK